MLKPNFEEADRPGISKISAIIKMFSTTQIGKKS